MTTGLRCRAQSHNAHGCIDRNDARRTFQIENLKKRGLRVLLQDDRANEVAGEDEEYIHAEPADSENSKTVCNLAEIMRHNDRESGKAS
jgi:hypothetical protein